MICKTLLYLFLIQSPVVDGAHGKVPVIEVHGLSFLPISSDAQSGLARPDRTGKGSFGHHFPIEVDPLFLSVPTADQVMPSVSLDQAGLGLLKGGRIVRPPEPVPNTIFPSLRNSPTPQRSG